MTQTVAAPLAIAGRVVLPDGAPVAGARVFLLADGAADVVRDAGLEPLSCRTGPDGAFRLSGVAAGAYRVDVSATEGGEHGTCRTVSAVVHAGSAPLRIVVAPGRAARGRVLDADGRPVAGAEVRCWSEVPGAAPAARVRTSADGRFALRSLDATPHLLRVAAEGFAPARREVPESGDEVVVRLDVAP